MRRREFPWRLWARPLDAPLMVSRIALFSIVGRRFWRCSARSCINAAAGLGFSHCQDDAPLLGWFATSWVWMWSVWIEHWRDGFCPITALEAYLAEVERWVVGCGCLLWVAKKQARPWQHCQDGQRISANGGCTAEDHTARHVGLGGSRLNKRLCWWLWPEATDGRPGLPLELCLCGGDAKANHGAFDQPGLMLLLGFPFDWGLAHGRAGDAPSIPRPVSVADRRWVLHWLNGWRCARSAWTSGVRRNS